MTIANIMPQAVNETVRDFAEGGAGDVAPTIGAIALTPVEVQQAVDALYAAHDGQMIKLLTKLAVGEEPTEK